MDGKSQSERMKCWISMSERLHSHHHNSVSNSIGAGPQRDAAFTTLVKSLISPTLLVSQITDTRTHGVARFPYGQDSVSQLNRTEQNWNRAVVREFLVLKTLACVSKGGVVVLVVVQGWGGHTHCRGERTRRFVCNKGECLVGVP